MEEREPSAFLGRADLQQTGSRGVVSFDCQPDRIQSYLGDTYLGVCEVPRSLDLLK